MSLLRHTYGKGRVRVMRVHRDGARHSVRELTVQVMLEGDFARAFTEADNATSVSTDTMRNLVNVVAHDEPDTQAEPFCAAVARRLLERHPQVARATVTALETRWARLTLDGAPHPHAFALDGNGRPFARVAMTREGATTESGLSGFTVLKATGSGWAGFAQDSYTTLPETTDRIAATAMEARWRWARVPADCEAANARLLDAMLRVFAGTYSRSLQDSLYRMGTAALAAVPEAAEVSLACPNKHYLPFDLARFGIEGTGRVFVATDEPHGQIECTVGRD